MTDTELDELAADAELVATLERIADDLETLPRVIVLLGVALAAVILLGDAAVVVAT